MSNLSAKVIRLEKTPDLKLLLIKAVFKRSPTVDRDLNAHVLPNSQFLLEHIKLDKSLIKPFHSVVFYSDQTENVHPCYLHTLAFPLHLKLLLLPASPFSLLGLIHLSNQIKQMRPIKINEYLTMTACFGRLNKHAKGWTFSINVAFYNSDELVWSSQSQYLSRTKNADTLSQKSVSGEKIDSETIFVKQQLSENLGRQYAKVSGDFNPIHLSKLSAKMFGLKRHIIHGMWTKAFGLSMLQNTQEASLTHAFDVNVEFKQPLYLPSKINFAIQQADLVCADERQVFKVQSVDQTNTYTHLTGTINTI